jgi:plasmid stabilization system protein ParE
VSQVYKRPQFLLDVAEELTWLSQAAGADVAAAWFEALTGTIRQLEKHPLIGRKRKDLSPAGIRSWRISGFPRWLIFYGVDKENNVVLYRVRQGTMNLVVLKMES